MAIKVNGTTVIDDSRNFTNIAGGFKTVNGTSVVGSGDISAGGISTTYAAVDTYVFATIPGSYSPNNGGTIAGSSLRPANSNNYRPVSLSGTWRVMGAAGYISGGTNPSEAYARTLYVRIS